MSFIDFLRAEMCKNVGTRIVTILYSALKFQVDCACFCRGKANANFDEKVEYR